MTHATLRRTLPVALIAVFLFSVLFLAQCKGGAAPAPALRSPVRIAGAGAGQLAVTDYGTDAVCLVDRSSLVPSSCFAISGKPLGVAATADRIFVGNETLHTIGVYDRTGIKLADLPGAFSVPTSLAVDEANGLLFVLDGAAKTVSLLTFTGGPAGVIAGVGLNPVAMTVDPVRQEVLVSDYGNLTSFAVDPGVVRIYTYGGTLVTSIGSAGLSRPQGLFVDQDHIFIADSWRGQVTLFSRLSSTLVAAAGSLGSFGDGPGRLFLPLDVLVDPSSRDVYVANNRPARIERFAKGGIIP